MHCCRAACLTRSLSLVHTCGQMISRRGKAGLCRPKAVAELETTAATMRLSDSMSKSAEVWLPAVSIGCNHHNEGLVSPSGHEANELPSQDSRNGGAVVDS